MADKKEDKTYSIGYGRPPQNTQFKKGKSGNPKGRPKGSLNLMTEIASALKEKITVNNKGGSKKLSKSEIIGKQLVNKAVAGDLKAITVLLNETRNNPTTQPLNEIEARGILPALDELVVNSTINRIRRGNSDEDKNQHDISSRITPNENEGMGTTLLDERKPEQ